MTRIDLTTRYLGMALKHPIVASASPLTGSIDSLKRLEDAGIAAVVLPSLFEEQIEHEEMAAHNLMLSGAELSPEASGFFPEQQHYNTGPDRYLTLISRCEEGIEGAGDREPERLHAGRLDQHGEEVRGGGGGRNRTERLLPGDQSRGQQRVGGSALHRTGEVGRRAR